MKSSSSIMDVALLVAGFPATEQPKLHGLCDTQASWVLAKQCGRDAREAARDSPPGIPCGPPAPWSCNQPVPLKPTE